ncbi:MAG: helix-turn-helix domain-containing protein, partial [Bacteroidetes bacterium]|nr:helix-turn-helix domain-containing protein [Bacteroidota bacterium]MBU1580630.1 helix-turn-helix domain-containing protein [Bacteroidota bacterium]
YEILKAQAENSLTVRFHRPDPALQWIVKQFESIRYDDSNQLLSDKFIPRPDAALVFHFKNIPEVIMPIEAKLKPFFVAPVVSLPNQMQIAGAIDGFIVICKASVLSKIFGLDMLEKSQMIVDLPLEIFAPLWKKLNKIATDEGRIDCFSNFIQNYANEGYKYDIVDIIYNNIAENITEFKLEAIHSNHFQSISTLQRNFNKRVGVSMKRLMRISRVNYIFNAMINLPGFDAQKMMFDGNYYDQSHFIKDFKELTGETPKQFFHHNSDLCRILSGVFKADVSVI